jgi:RNA polymerase sigma-70 factor (sigma-E family)
LAAVRLITGMTGCRPDAANFEKLVPQPDGRPVRCRRRGLGLLGGEVESWEQTLADLASGRGVALKRHAFLLCGDEAQADDLVQEALVRAFTRPLRVPRPNAAEAYVRVIMVNLYIDGVRRQSRWRRVAPLLRPADMTPDPTDQVSDRDAMLTALRSLSPRQRACVVLRYYEDLPVAKVAGVLGVGEGTVKRYLSEAMSHMAARLSSAESG